MAPFLTRLHRRALGLCALLPLLALGPSCSLLFDEGDPFPDEEEQGATDFTGPQSFEEEFPFVRITELGIDYYRAVLTSPVGSGEDIKKILLANSSFLKDASAAPSAEGQAENPAHTATIMVMANGGKVFNSNAKADQMPWTEVGSFRDVEDLLVIEGPERDLREVFQLIDSWYNGGPQVEIKSVIIETIDTDEFQRGVNQIADDSPIFRDADGAAFLRSIGGSFPTDSGGGVAQIGLIDSNFLLDAAIQLLEEESLVDIVSQPSIVTRNGVPASIESTTKVPYLEPGGFSTSGTASFTVKTNEVGVKLKVTPFLVGVDTIHLVIFAEVSRIGQDIVIGTDVNGAISAPSFNTRSATTEVYVRNGQTVAIGGLVLNEKRTAESRVPFLGSLPVLGWLFSSSETSSVQTKVTFLITPQMKERPSIDRIGEYFDPTSDGLDSSE